MTWRLGLVELMLTGAKDVTYNCPQNRKALASLFEAFIGTVFALVSVECLADSACMCICGNCAGALFLDQGLGAVSYLLDTHVYPVRLHRLGRKQSWHEVLDLRSFSLSLWLALVVFAAGAADD